MISRVQYFFRRRRGLPRWWEEAVLVVARSTRWKTRTKSLSSCSADLPVALASLSSSASSAVWWCVGGGRLLVSKTTPALRFGPAPPACKGKVILKDLRRECNVILLQIFFSPQGRGTPCSAQFAAQQSPRRGAWCQKVMGGVGEVVEGEKGVLSNPN